MPLLPALRTSADWLRRRFRASDGWFIGLATAVGALAGLLTVLQGRIAHALQMHFFGIAPDTHLSLAVKFSPLQLLVLPLGGLLLGGFTVLVRARRRALVDAVEANALHGGRMSMRDNLVVSVQTLLSNGFGASVGLEAAYAQMGAGAGSHLGRILRVRRADIRTLVGAGAGAAIAAAFGAPLTGAFYAFEIVIGAYSPSALAPVAAAALAGTFVAQTMGLTPYLLSAPAVAPLRTRDYAIAVALGMLCALVGVAIMRLVAWVEQHVNATRLPYWLRPAAGGALLVPLALLSPQVLSSGHGALHADLATGATLTFLATVFFLKSTASVVSLGFGFRGGLFFASLFLGTLLGSLFAKGVDQGLGFPLIDPANASLVAMAALAAGIIGSPMTMAMLVLEATHDFVLTSAVMAAVLVTSTLVRQVFGYSFSTWRLHLRGESIKSARDVGWMRSLSAGKLMQVNPDVASADLSVGELRKRFPLGSVNRVVLVDANGRYVGIVQLATLYADGAREHDPAARFARMKDRVLRADKGIGAVMRAFDAAQTDELAVVDADHRLLGLLTEAFVRRRYAEELELKHREMLGERVEASE